MVTNPNHHELTVPAAKVQIYGILAAIVLFLALSVPFQQIYDRPIFRFEELNLTQGLIIALVFFGGAALHELIHGLTALCYAGISPDQAKFGFQWKSMTPYFHSTAPIAAAKYRVVVIMPLILMGIIPYLAGMALGLGWLTAFGIAFIITAGGDLLILWLMRNVDSRSKVQDHPEKIGLIVIG